MSNSIGRMYLIQSWNGASESSGEQIGNRLKASTQMYLANGKANIEAFKEEEPRRKKVKETPLEYRLYPSQKVYDNLEKLLQEVEKKYIDLEIGDEEYYSALDALDPKLERAWKNLCKAKGWWNELGEPSPEEKAIEKEKERIGKAYHKELQAHNKAIEKELREAYRMGNKNAVKRTTGCSGWWERLHGIKIVAIVWVVVVILVKMGGG